MVTSWLAWAIFGLVVGAIARLLYPGRQSIGFFATMCLGVAGSLLGGLALWLYEGQPDRPIEGAGWIVSIVGAMIVVWIALYAGGRRSV